MLAACKPLADARDVGPAFRRNVELEKNRSDMEDGFEVHNHFDGTTQKRAAAWLSEQGIKEDYGYVQTDLALLELRKRGGCDFIHVTNGDNLYHVDFFRRHLDAMHDPTVVATAVDFYCHHVKKFTEVAYRIGQIDLATQLFRAAYLDARNATFVTGPYERDCKNQKCDLSAYFRKKLANVDWQNLDVDSEWSRLRIFNADGHFAKDISRDVGHAGRRAIHGHGPLLWHL